MGVGVGLPTVMIGGTAVATSYGFMNATEANESVVFDATADTIREGLAYDDTLMRDEPAKASGQPPQAQQTSIPQVLYVGQFSCKKPQGRGRLFWPPRNGQEGTPAFIGEFSNGLPRNGIFIDEHAVVVGRMKKALAEEMYNEEYLAEFVEDGFQPELAVAPKCVSCDRPPMISQCLVFFPCTHGNVCSECAEMIRKDSKKCPTCQQEIESINRI